MDVMIENKNTKNTKLEFDIKNIDVSYVNSLRRVLLTEITTPVFKGFPHSDNNIDIKTNKTDFHNEYLKHRIENIPICLKNRTKIDALCKNYRYKLDVVNKTSEKIYVTTDDLKLYKISNDEINEQNFLPVEIIDKNKYHIPICVLKPKISVNDEPQELSLDIGICKGKPKDNSSWSIVSKSCFYNIKDEDKISKIKKELDLNEFKSRDFDILDSQRHFIKNSFHFILETVHVNISPMTIINEAFTYLINKFNEYLIKLDETEIIQDHLIITNDKDILYYIIKTDNGYKLRLENECYTLGNIIKHQLSINENIHIVSFNKNHDHDSYSFVNIILQDETYDIKLALSECFQNIIDIYTDLSKQMSN